MSKTFTMRGSISQILMTFLIGIFFNLLFLLGCGSKEDSPVSSGTTEIVYDENGFVTTGVGTLRISMVGTGSDSGSSGLRLAAEPTDADEKYFSNEYTMGGQPDDLTIYVTKMTLKRDEAGEGEDLEVPIFYNPDGRPLRVTGRYVDMSNFFTVIKCYGEDGTIFEEECPCGVDADGGIIEKVPGINDDGSESDQLVCPDWNSGVVVEKNPVSFINVSQEGTFSKLAVTYKASASVKGCVEGYMQQTGYTPETPTLNVNWERYCTQTGAGSDVAANGTGNPSSTYLDTTFTTEAELSNFQITSQDQENADYAINGGVSITSEGDGPQITMVIDTSSMLRFFKDDNYNDRTISEYSGYGGSYFYVRQFGAQNFVFVGEPGIIRGYSVVQALAGQDDDGSNEPAGTAANPAAYDECSSDLSTCTAKAKGRLSVIYDSDDTPMLFNLNFAQGSGLDVTNRSKDGIDPTVITSDDSLSGTYKFNLDSVDGTGSSIITDLYQIDLDAAVGESFNTYGGQKTEGESTNGWFWGRLRMTREF